MITTVAAEKFCNEQNKLSASMRELLDRADRELRGLTSAEKASYDAAEAQLDKSIADSQAAVAHDAMRTRLDSKAASTATLERRNQPNPQAANQNQRLAAGGMTIPGIVGGQSVGSFSKASLGGESRNLNEVYAAEGWEGVLDSPEYRNLFNDCIRRRLAPELLHDQFAELRTLTMATSNIAIPTIMQNRIVELMQPLSPFYRLMTRLPAPEVGSVPVETGIGTAIWIADATAVTLGDPAQTLKTISAKNLGTGIGVSRTLIEGNAYPLEEYLSRKLSQRLANGFELGALRGSGAGNEPSGILTYIAANDAGQLEVTGAAGSLVSNDFFDIEYHIDAAFRFAGSLRWIIADPAVKEARMLKDTTGQYLWKLTDASSLKDGAPATINGYPYDICGQFAAAATTVPWGILGNWNFFECYERRAIEIFPDMYTASASRMVNFYAWWRGDFLVTLTKAFGIGKYL